MEKLLEEEKAKNESLLQQLETEKKNSVEMKKRIAEINEILETNIAEKNEALEKYNISLQRVSNFNHARQSHTRTVEKTNQRGKGRGKGRGGSGKVGKSHFDIKNELGEGGK